MDGKTGPSVGGSANKTGDGWMREMRLQQEMLDQLKQEMITLDSRVVVIEEALAKKARK